MINPPDQIDEKYEKRPILGYLYPNLDRHNPSS
jgi:hypothetical protein